MSPYWFLVAIAVWLSPVRASADIPPSEPDTCTLERVSKLAPGCEVCSTYFGNPADHCMQSFDAGYTRACRGYGASVWKEIWCKGPLADAGESAVVDAAVMDASPGRASGGGGCAVAPAEPETGLLAALGLLALAWRGRSRGGRS